MSLQSIRENILKGCEKTFWNNNGSFLGECGKDRYDCPVCQAKLSTLDLTEKEIEKNKDNVIRIVLELLKNKDYMVCRYCNAIAYGDGNCHCGKSFKTDENWIFCIELFDEELKQKLVEK